MKYIKTSIPIKLAALLAGAALLGSVSQSALALTASGTTISNLSTLSYSVGGVSQTDIGSSVGGNTAGAGTATTFVVDKKVNLTVVTTDVAAVSVVPGQTNVVTTFTVTNTGNDPQDFALAAANVASGQTLFTKTDDFNFSTGPTAYVEDGTHAGVYNVSEDTATHIDALGAGSSKTVYVVATVPSSQVNGDAALVSLTATARINDGAGTLGGALTETAGAETPGSVDIVFADGAGSDDSSRDAAYSARSAYVVATSALTVTKTSTLLCDTVNGTTNPKRIPGAYVQWTLTIANGGGAGSSAVLASVTDTLDTNTTFDPDLVTSASVCATPASGAGKGFKRTSTRTGETTPAYYTTTNGDADGADATAGVVTLDYTKLLPAMAGYAAGELKAGESTTVTFNVTIN